MIKVRRKCNLFYILRGKLKRKELEYEIVESIYRMVNDLDFIGIKRISDHSKQLMLSEKTVALMNDLLKAIDEGNIKVANQLVNHSKA